MPILWAAGSFIVRQAWWVVPTGLTLLYNSTVATTTPPQPDQDAQSITRLTKYSLVLGIVVSLATLYFMVTTKGRKGGA